MTHSAITRYEGYDDTQWKEWATDVEKRLNELSGEYPEIHLALYAPIFCSFLLGIRLTNRHRLQVYRYDFDTKFYNVWHSVQGLRNRGTDNDMSFTVCEPPVIPPHALAPEKSKTKRAVALNIGKLDYLSSMASYVQEEIPDVAFYQISRRTSLEANDPQTWVTAAREIAGGLEQISERGQFELYRFISMPTTLALMVGAALSGVGRHVHLMQFENGTYREVLALNT